MHLKMTLSSHCRKDNQAGRSSWTHQASSHPSTSTSRVLCKSVLLPEEERNISHPHVCPHSKQKIPAYSSCAVSFRRRVLAVQADHSEGTLQADPASTMSPAALTGPQLQRLALELLAHVVKGPVPSLHRPKVNCKKEDP